MAGVLKAKVGGQWVPIIGSGMSAEVARWNSAWGVIATGSGLGQPVTCPLATWTALTTAINVTLLSGRRYRIAFKARAAAPATTQQADASVRIGMQDNATAPPAGVFDDYGETRISYNNMLTTGIRNGDGATHTLTMMGQAYAGQSVMLWPTEFYVEDVGPAVYQAVPVPAQAIGPWIAPTLLNNWVNFAVGYNPVGYRKIGDIVYLRGMVKSGTVGSTVFNLPVEFRPPYIQHCAISANDAFAVLRVQPDGNAVFSGGSVAGWVDFGGGVQFSTTA